jgi:hypothetical protein
VFCISLERVFPLAEKAAGLQELLGIDETQGIKLHQGDGHHLC